jgi:hypothetical protein
MFVVPAVLLCSDPKQTVVVSGGELGHFMRLASLDDASHNEAALRRTAMHAQSQARYSKWSNTLEAQRMKKKQDRVLRLEAIERAQQAIDREEEAYQEAQRRVVLDRANRLLWQENDKVKQFHGGLLHAAVIKEREAQIELQARKRAQQQMIARTYHDLAEEDRLKALEMDRIEQEKRTEKARGAAKQQLQQLAEVRERQALERAEQVALGDRIKRQAADAVRESAAEEAKRHAQQQSYNQEYLRANAEQLALKQARAAHEAKEDGKIVAFAAEKERLLQLRREHEKSKFEIKQARFEKMLRRQYEHLSDIKERESQRLNAQVAEIEQRTEQRFQNDAQKAAQLREQTRVSRQAQLDRKARERARQAANDAALTREWEQRNAEMQEAEWEEERALRETALRLQATLREQMVVKEERARAEVNKEYDEARMMTEARAREDAVFHAYAEQTLKELEVKGKSTIPLQLRLKAQANPPLLDVFQMRLR